MKALAWNPNNPNIIATGAGTADKKIRLWDISQAEQVSEHQTESQICNIVFSKQTNEIITSHGFSENDINTWSLKNFEKTQSFKGHRNRVLYMALNSKGDILVTGAGDETLRFWDIGNGVQQ